VFGAMPAEDGLIWYTVEILERRPHDSEAFTQGLEFADGALYESTGLYGSSSLRSVDPVSGTVTAQTDLSAELFGEGLTVVDDRIVQLTWKSGRAISYDRATLTPVGEHRYEGEGWGLCRAADTLWMSDGSDHLSRRDTRSFGLIETVRVTSPDASLTVHSLNELECTEERIIANMWQTDRLLVIDVRTPGEARVEAVIDAAPLAEDVRRSFPDHPVDVLNGVADPPVIQRAARAPAGRGWALAASSSPCSAASSAGSCARCRGWALAASSSPYSARQALRRPVRSTAARTIPLKPIKAVIYIEI